MKILYKTGLGLLVLLAMYSCQNNSANATITPAVQGNIMVQTFKTDAGWGYAIYLNNKIFIKQTFIPAIAGNKGFANEADANKVATLVAGKLKNHEKPIVQLKDLEAFGIAGRKE